MACKSAQRLNSCFPMQYQQTNTVIEARGRASPHVLDFLDNINEPVRIEGPVCTPLCVRFLSVPHCIELSAIKVEPIHRKHGCTNTVAVECLSQVCTHRCLARTWGADTHGCAVRHGISRAQHRSVCRCAPCNSSACNTRPRRSRLSKGHLLFHAISPAVLHVPLVPAHPTLPPPSSIMICFLRVPRKEREREKERVCIIIIECVCVAV